jgi:hypothetical protein
MAFKQMIRLRYWQTRTSTVSVDADSWESIIASVSAGGELFNRFYAARDFHESTGEIRITQTPTQHAPNGHAEAR